MSKADLMCQIFDNPELGNWEDLCRRPIIANDLLEKDVRQILHSVERDGDKALVELTRRLDQVVLDRIEVSSTELERGMKEVSGRLKEAIDLAFRNIEMFHRSQVVQLPEIEPVPGVRLWRKNSAIKKVGFYIPGGSAPLCSTVLMLGVPAKIAGCEEVILCTPPRKDGTIDPNILYTASLVGISRIFKVGGAQAVAAMAFGTQSIPKVFKIFGPGNQYVNTAKILVASNGIAIDLPAGPTELLVVADATASPKFVAADILSQAEHGPDSQVIVLATDREIAENICKEVNAQLQTLPRKAIAEKSLNNSRLIVFDDMGDALQFANRYGAEHLILAVKDAELVADKVETAGSVFIGHYSPESAGDYASGTNHTLPTNGAAHAYSGVSVDSFVKKVTFQQISRRGLGEIGGAIEALASAEGLEAHRRAVTMRLSDSN